MNKKFLAGDPLTEIEKDIFIQVGEMMKIAAANMYAFIIGAMPIDGIGSSGPPSDGFYTEEAKSDTLANLKQDIDRSRPLTVTDEEYSNKKLELLTKIDVNKINNKLVAEADTTKLTASISLGGPVVVASVAAQITEELNIANKPIVHAMLDNTNIEDYYKTAILYELYGPEPWGKMKREIETNEKFVSALFKFPNKPAPNIKLRG